MKIDYIVPILRSGAVPAVYIANNLKDITIYKNSAFNYNGKNEFSKEKCKQLDIEYFTPLFPWEILEIKLEHPDDLEENISF